MIARDPSRLAPRVRDTVEVVTGSHGDPAVVEAAFDGADAVFWLVPPDPAATGLEAAYAGFTRPAAAAFARRGVRRVVGISALGRGTPGDAGLVSASLAMDDVITASGVGYRALALPSFMENLLRQVEPIGSQGMFFGPLAAGLEAPACATRDIAATAAALLLDGSWSGQEEVPVLGPEDLSCDDMARILSDVLGTQVRYQRVPFDDFRNSLTAHGHSEAMADGMVAMMRAKDAGLDSTVPRTPAATAPTTFRRFCEDTLKPAPQG